MPPSDDSSADAKPPAVLSRNEGGHDLQFPVLEIFRDCICAVHGVKALTLAMKQAVKTGYYDGALMIDQGGRVYEVNRAVVNTGSLATTLLNSLIGVAGFVIVDFVVSDVTLTYDLNSLKEKVLTDIRRGGIWEERGDCDGLVTRVSQCSAISEVVKVLVGDGENGT